MRRRRRNTEERALNERALQIWNQGQECHVRGELERAIELYTESIDLFPTAEAHTFRGWAFSHYGHLDGAIKECKRAIEVDPSFGNPYNDIGSYLVAQGKVDEAVDWLEKAKVAERYQPRHFPYMNMGRIYYLKGMVLPAIREFEQALQLHPGDVSCRSALAQLNDELTLN